LERDSCQGELSRLVFGTPSWYRRRWQTFQCQARRRSLSCGWSHLQFFHHRLKTRAALLLIQPWWLKVLQSVHYLIIDVN
jgi:hypothetical protein